MEQDRSFYSSPEPGSKSRLAFEAAHIIPYQDFEPTELLALTYLDGSPEDIESVYHLAKSGVEVSMKGHEGETLALVAALDLERLGKTEATTWVNTIYEERYDRGLNATSERERVIGSVDAVVAAKQLWLREVPGGLEKLAIAYGTLVDMKFWDIEFAHKSGRTDLLALRRVTIDKIGMYNDILNVQDILEFSGFDVRDDQVRMATALLRTMRDAAIVTPKNADFLYEILKSQGIGELLKSGDSALTNAWFALLDKLTEFVGHDAPLLRAAGMNALADTRDIEIMANGKPTRKTRRRISAVLSDDVFRGLVRRESIQDSEHTNQELFSLMDARTRLERGTVFDVALWEMVGSLANNRTFSKL